MWPDVVVPEVELADGPLQAVEVADGKLIELILQRAEETLDAPILPRAAWRRQLMVDAEPAQGEAEQARGERGIVVCPDRCRFAEGFDGGDEGFQCRDSRTVGKRPQSERQSAAVIDDAKNRMDLFGKIAFAGEVQSPHGVDWLLPGNATLVCFAQLRDFVAMFAHDLGDPGLAHADLALRRKQAVKGVCELVATLVAQCLKPNDFAPDPDGLSSASIGY